VEAGMRKTLFALMVSLAPCLSHPAFAGDSSSGKVISGSWRIEAIANAAAFDSAQTQFEFLDDGRVSSTVGCNRILGKPVIDGARIAFGPMAATRRACFGPVADLETKYLAALDAVRSWRVQENLQNDATLTLLDASGAPLVTLARAR
jgi:heat shock protein HslJ